MGQTEKSVGFTEGISVVVTATVGEAQERRRETEVQRKVQVEESVRSFMGHAEVGKAVYEL
jgi:hypothetical protein